MEIYLSDTVINSTSNLLMYTSSYWYSSRPRLKYTIHQDRQSFFQNIPVQSYEQTLHKYYFQIFL